MGWGGVTAWTAAGTRFKHSQRVGNRVFTRYFPGPFGAEVAERIAERRGQRGKLKGLTNLELFVLRETKVTDAGVAELKKALPNCEIVT